MKLTSREYIRDMPRNFFYIIELKTSILQI